MNLIGITGKARSGKDTFATHMWTHYGATRISFADPVKNAAQEIFGLTSAQRFDDNLKEEVIPLWGMSPREIYQEVGEKTKESFGQEVWIKRWSMMYDLARHTDHVMVPDVRFDEEAAYLRSLGGVIVEVRRDAAGLPGKTGRHRSERGLTAPADFVIHNNGTLAEFITAIDKVILANTWNT